MTVREHNGAGPLTTSAPAPDTPDLSAVRPDVEDSPLGGGERLRPQLCVAGWSAGGGQGDKSAVLNAAAALELFQALALIHDDVMDTVAQPQDDIGRRVRAGSTGRSLQSAEPGVPRSSSSIPAPVNQWPTTGGT